VPQQGVFINIFSVGKYASGGAVKRQFPRAVRRAVISGMGKTTKAGWMPAAAAQHLCPAFSNTNILCTRGKEAVPYKQRAPRRGREIAGVLPS